MPVIPVVRAEPAIVTGARASRPRRILSPRRAAKWLAWAVGTGACVGLAAPNGLLSAFATFVLVVTVGLLHRPGEPQALLFAGVYQWLQASALLFSADVKGEGLAELHNLTWAPEATFLTLAAVLAFGIGAHIGSEGTATGPAWNDPKTIEGLSIQRLMVAWLIALPVSELLIRMGLFVPAIRQVLVAVAQVKWVIIFLLAATVFARNRGYGALCLVVAVEAINGMLGFFAEFKNIFILVGLTLLSGRTWLRGRKLAAVIAIAVALPIFGVYWTAIKQDYREYANQGTSQQVVLVGPVALLTTAAELVEMQTSESLGEALDQLAQRVAYVQYFALAMDYVPDIVGYQNGELWLGAIWHILVPRIVDPSKPTIDDSTRTAQFTGLRISGAEQGTSIGLGYVAESYIDLGPYLMFAPILIWGFLVGRAYRFFATGQVEPLLGMACATVLVMFGAHLVETSNAKMLGGFVTGFLAFFVLMHFFPKRFMRLLAESRW